jgi:hypothetical protein
VRNRDNGSVLASRRPSVQLSFHFHTETRRYHTTAVALYLTQPSYVFWVHCGNPRVDLTQKSTSALVVRG